MTDVITIRLMNGSRKDRGEVFCIKAFWNNDEYGWEWFSFDSIKRAKNDGIKISFIDSISKESKEKILKYIDVKIK